MKDLLDELGVDAAVGVDFETYYDDDYSLRKMSTTEYIVDPRFKVQLVSIQWHNDRKALVLSPSDFKAWAKEEVTWGRTAFLAHHTHFDGLIAAHHFGIKPAFYLDTLSMARPIMPVQVGGSLKAVCAAFGRQAKKLAGALEDVKGVQTITSKQFKALAAYAGKDIEDTWFIFKKMLPYTPVDELRLIDLTVKMYAHPTLLIDGAMTDAVHTGEIDKKAKLLKRAKTEKEALMSNEKFANLLRREGVDPPLKVSKTTNKVTLALARNDLQFKALLKHPNAKVRKLVEARMGVKSTLAETRAKKLTDRSALGAQPVYLKYWGAGTGRWSGSDKMNWQNFTRGSDLRKAIHAPPGHKLIIADQAQIEARLNAWRAGQRDIVEAFASGSDVYSIAASKIYSREIDKAKNPNERFVGKVATLALGYGAGAKRFAEMLRVGAFGPPVDITDDEAQHVVSAWRSANSAIVGEWRRLENAVKSAFFGHQTIKHGILSISGVPGKGFIQMPGGTMLRYDGVEMDEEGVRYISAYRNGRDGPSVTYSRLYGGLLVENVTQALARLLLAGQMLQIAKLPTRPRIATTTHDEVLLVVKDAQAEKTLAAVKKIMSTPPDWAQGLPLAVDAHISQEYDK